MWLIIFAAAIAASIAGTVYTIVCVGKFGLIKKLSGKSKLLKNIVSLAIVAAVFILISCLMSIVDAAVVLLYLVMFMIIFGIIVRIISAAAKKQFKVNWQGWLSILSTAVCLVYGYYLCNNVWETDYNLKTEKDINLKIAMFADSHIGTTFDGDGFSEELKKIESQNPDILLIPGDFVDDWSEKSEMLKACEALGNINVKYGVWFSYGNHDEGLFSKRDFTAEELEEALKSNGVHVLSDEYKLIDDSFYVVGRLDKSLYEDERKNINDLLSGLDTDKYIIVLDHEPNDYENEANSAADLVLSGHTHGGQLIPITYVGEWLDMNDRTYGLESRNNTNFIVTSGISDWAMRFKTGTKSEYVIVNVEKN